MDPLQYLWTPTPVIHFMFLSASAIRRTASSRPRPDPNGVFKDLDSLPARAQSNQQAIVSALHKLAEKQAARQYNSSSHISLLTQHVSLLSPYPTPLPSFLLNN